MAREIKSTVVIPTIGRPTLLDAVNSALREGLSVIVVGDGPVEKPDLPESVYYIEMGKRFGVFGSSSYNLGAYLAKTEFITSLADDDELGEGFGDLLIDKLNSDKDIDIWIPTLVYEEGRCCDKPDLGIRIGNVAAPTYRVDIFKDVPFSHDLSILKNEIDYHHIALCISKGYTLSWHTELEYLVRPKLFGSSGSFPIKVI
jgi:hypothetical protein